MPKSVGFIKVGIGAEIEALVQGIEDSKSSIEKGFDRILDKAETSSKELRRKLTGAVEGINENIERLTTRYDAFDKVFTNLELSTGQIAAIVKGMDEAIQSSHAPQVVKNFSAGFETLTSRTHFTSQAMKTLNDTVHQSQLAFENFKKISTVAFDQLLALVPKARIALVALAGPIGIISGLILGLAAVAYTELNNQLTVNERLARRFKELNAEISGELAIEEEKLKGVRKVLEDTTATRDEQIRAFKELKRINPEYFKSLDTEKAKIDEVTESVENYLKGIKARAEVRIFEAELDTVVRSLAALKQGIEKVEPSFIEKLATGIKNGLSPALAVAKIDALGFAKTAAGITFLTQEAEELTRKIVESQKEVGRFNSHVVAGFKDIEKGVKLTKDEMKALIDVARKLFIGEGTDFLAAPLSGAGLRTESLVSPENQGFSLGFQPQSALDQPVQLGFEANLAAAEAFNNIISEVNNQTDIAAFSAGLAGEKFDEMSTRVEFLAAKMRELRETGFLPTSPLMQLLIEQFKEWESQIESLSGTMKTFVAAMGASSQAMIQASKAGATSFGELGKAALKAATDVLRAKMIEAISISLAKTFQSLGPLAIPLAGGIAAGVVAVFNKIISLAKVPALAGGGILQGLGLVGEQGPELIRVGSPSRVISNPETRSLLSGLGDNMSLSGGVIRIERGAGSDLNLILGEIQLIRNKTGVQ